MQAGRLPLGRDVWLDAPPLSSIPPPPHRLPLLPTIPELQLEEKEEIRTAEKSLLEWYFLDFVNAASDPHYKWRTNTSPPDWLVATPLSSALVTVWELPFFNTTFSLMQASSAQSYSIMVFCMPTPLIIRSLGHHALMSIRVGPGIPGDS